MGAFFSRDKKIRRDPESKTDMKMLFKNQDGKVFPPSDNSMKFLV